MEKIVIHAYVDLVILLLPCVSYMLYDWMQEGMIFEKYGIAIQKFPMWLAKPLGYCLKCFHVWVVIIFSIYTEVDFLKFLISLGLSYVILTKLFFD